MDTAEFYKYINIEKWMILTQSSTIFNYISTSYKNHIFYKKVDFNTDNLDLTKVKIDFKKNNFYCSIHFIKDTPYTKHDNKIFYIAIEEN